MEAMEFGRGCHGLQEFLATPLARVTSLPVSLYIPAVEKMAATAMNGVVADASLTEAKKNEYFSSINSMARKIMQERERIKEKYGSAWEDMSPAEQDTAIDDGMMEPKIRARYAMHRMDREELVCYPKMLIQTGQKIVHFGEEVSICCYFMLVLTVVCLFVCWSVKFALRFLTA